MDDKDLNDWADFFWACGFTLAFGLVGAGIVLGAAYWTSIGINL